MDNTKLSNDLFAALKAAQVGHGYYDSERLANRVRNIAVELAASRATDAPAQGEQMPVAWAELRKRAEAARKDIIRSHGWEGTVEMLDAMRIDEQYLLAASPAVIIELLDAAEGRRASPVAADKPVAWFDTASSGNIKWRDGLTRSDFKDGQPLFAAPVAASADAAPAGAVAVPRTTLELINAAMNHMGDVLNGMDAVEPEDEDATGPAFEAIRALLSPAAAEVTPAPATDPHRLTERKTNDIMARGYQKVGYVLQKPGGDYCIVAQSAVRWLDQAQGWKLMHPASEAAQATAAGSVPCTGCDPAEGFCKTCRAVEAEQAVRKAIEDYYRALDSRQHGGVAQDRAFNAIQMALGMDWPAWRIAQRNAAADAQSAEGGKEKA